LADAIDDAAEDGVGLLEMRDRGVIHAAVSGS
jgi:hypothetical protein